MNWWLDPAVATGHKYRWCALVDARQMKQVPGRKTDVQGERRLQLRMGLNDSLTEHLCFEVECKPEETPVLHFVAASVGS